jgi:hypothetical protein
MNKLAPTTSLTIGQPVYKINRAGFSVDNFKIFDPEGYSIICRFGETCNV